MLIFLYGPDAWRLRQSVQDIILKYKQKHQSGANFFMVDCATGGLPAGGQDSAFELMENAAKNVSFFDEIKLIVAKNVFSTKATAERVEQFIKEQKLTEIKEVVLLISECAEEKVINAANKKLFATLKENAKPLQYIEPLAGIKLANWVTKECQNYGASIYPAALRLLIDRVGTDSWVLHNEILKLANMTKVITTDHVARLVSAKEDLNIFEFTDALAERQRGKALSLMYQELASGKEAHYLLSMIVFQFRNLLIIKDLSERLGNPQLVAQKSGLHPFVVRKLMLLVRKFTLEELKDKFSQLAEYDIAAKEGRLNLDDVLYNFILT